MNFLLVAAFLFFAGSLIGWTIELVWRRFFSKNNPERKWINPGFLVGPYLPLYGFSLVILFSLSFIDVSFIENFILQKAVLFVLMALCITVFEFHQGNEDKAVGLFKLLGKHKGNYLSAVFVFLVRNECTVLFYNSSEDFKLAFLVYESSFVFICCGIFLRNISD